MKKVFLSILQDSQKSTRVGENTNTGACLIVLQNF